MTTAGSTAGVRGARRRVLGYARMGELREGVWLRPGNVAVELPNRDILGDHPAPQHAEKPQLMTNSPRGIATPQQPRAIPLNERTQPPRLQTRLRHRHRLLVEAAASTIEMAQSDDGTMPIRLPASPRETQADQDTTHPREVYLGIAH